MEGGGASIPGNEIVHDNWLVRSWEAHSGQEVFEKAIKQDNFSVQKEDLDLILSQKVYIRVVPKFWKNRQYQNFDDIDIDIDVEMEEDIDIDTNIDIEKFMRFWYWYWGKYCKILSLY